MRRTNTDHAIPERRAGGHSGRRPGDSGTRETILMAARDVFAADGFEKATLRGIAARAGVDPALVRHFYIDKESLFDRAMVLPWDADEIVAAIVTGDPERMGERIVLRFLELWEAGTNREVFTAMIRSAVTHEKAAAMVRDLITRRLVGPVTQALHVLHPELRATLVGSQLLGLAMVRYVTRVEPLASLDRVTVARVMGANVQRYLSGDLDLSCRR
ncbi:MAG: TetR family transcriptional regulator [Actinomycetes bacterium]